MITHARSLLLRLGPLAALLVIAGIVTALVWRPLLLYGHSSYVDALRLLVFDDAIRSGNWLPRWVPHFYYGYGSLVFHFYAPLPYYVAEIFVLAGLGVVSALKATLVLTLGLSGVFMYLLARDYLSRPASFAAAVLYMLAPYHLVDMMVRHAFGEHIAFVWLPLAAWGVIGCVRGKPGALRFVAGATGVAGLALSHNIAALMFMPVLGIWWVYEFARARHLNGAVAGSLSTIAGLALSAFFWLPAFVEKELVFAKESLTDYFKYADHFVLPFQLFRPSWGFGGSGPGPGDDMSFQIGIAHWIWIILALVGFAAAAIRQRRQPAVSGVPCGALACFGIFLVGTFMTLEASQFLWKAIPTLAYVQFPWRFLVIAAFGSSLFAAFAVDLFSAGNAGRARILAVAAGVTALVCYAPYLDPRFEIVEKSGGRPPGSYATQMEKLADTAHFEDPRDHFSLTKLDESGIFPTSRDDYLPRTATNRPGAKWQTLAQAAGGTVSDLGRVGPNSTRMRASMAVDGAVLLNQFYFPGWQAQVDGREAPVTPETGTGRVMVSVPAGDHVVSIRFGSTPLRSGAGAVSLATLVLLLGFSIFSVVKRSVDVEPGRHGVLGAA